MPWADAVLGLQHNCTCVRFLNYFCLAAKITAPSNPLAKHPVMRIIPLLALACLALPLQAQRVSRMDNLQPEQKAEATAITLTGKLSTQGNSDFRQLRDLCRQLRSVDLSQADCPAIPNNAFHSRHQLEHVTLPAALRTIGTQAFFACTSLGSITLPKDVERVGDAAFSSCTALREIIIEGSPVLGEFAFARLSGLKTLTVNASTPPKASASTFAGIDCRKVKLVVPKGSELKYRRAEGWSAFYTAEKASDAVCRPSECLVPVPAQLEVDSTARPLDVRVMWDVVAAPGLANECSQAERILTERVGRGGRGRATLTLALDPTLTDGEAYSLKVHADGIDIHGGSAAGVFYGLMTLEQLLRADAEGPCCEAIPQLSITDTPRTHMRELMVDPCRIFVPFDELKKFIPEMARYKLNALHLHLVDDQAWRIEIKSYPRLTEVSSSRVGMDDMQFPISGYYTQQQMRELVAYAATYHVQVIPEIEMPGHEVAAIHAYPQLTCGAKEVPIRTTCGVSNELLCPAGDFTYEFLGNVFRELADIFPSKYIHLGGDEAGNPALDCWTTCPKCQELKRQLGITTTDRSENWRLQEYLFNRVIDTLRTKYGKTPMFWYETDFKRIQPGCVTFAWRNGLTKNALDAAVANNAKIMLCPGEHCYFDYPMARGDMPEVNWGMPVTSLKQTYALDPAWGMGADFERNNLFGVAGTLWSECINSPERIYYQAYPRALALAEVGWSAASKCNWEDFLRRLRPTLRDMQRRGITFSMQY